MKTAMKGFFAGAALALLAVPFTYAQAPRPELRDAGSKMRDEAISGHEYLMYQRLARDRAEITYHQYTRPAPVITRQQAKQAVVQAREDLSMSDAALAKLKAAHAKEPEVVKVIESIEKHHAAAHEACNMLEEHASKEDADHGACSECCADMWKELDAAKADTDKLFKLLKIQPPKMPAAKTDTAKKPAAKK